MSPLCHSPTVLKSLNKMEQLATKREKNIGISIKSFISGADVKINLKETAYLIYTHYIDCTSRHVQSPSIATKTKNQKRTIVES